MEVKDFAELYGMTVSDLADYTGYSRKTLYNIFSSPDNCNKRRIKAVARQLHAKALNDLTNEKMAADEKYRKRITALQIIRIEEKIKWQQAGVN